MMPMLGKVAVSLAIDRQLSSRKDVQELVIS